MNEDCGIKEFGKINEHIEVMGEEKNKYVPTSKSQNWGLPQKKSIDKSFIVAIIGIVCGIVILTLGLLAYNIGTGSESISYTSNQYYGGDAYTGIQQAAADASNNAGVAAKNIITAVRLVLIALGLITICNYLYKLTEIMERKA